MMWFWQSCVPCFLNRDLLKIKLKKQPINQEKVSQKKEEIAKEMDIPYVLARYFVFSGEIQNQAYNQEKQNIHILTKNGKVVDVVRASDQLNLEALSKPVTKYFICYPKG